MVPRVCISLGLSSSVTPYSSVPRVVRTHVDAVQVHSARPTVLGRACQLRDIVARAGRWHALRLDGATWSGARQLSACRSHWLATVVEGCRGAHVRSNDVRELDECA